MYSGPAANAVDGPLLLADISGYTSFLRAVQEAHQDDGFAGGNIPDAYALMSALLDGIITKLVPPFTFSKLEGDAVFAFAEDGASVPRAEALLACFAACYADFRARLAAAMEVQTCTAGRARGASVSTSSSSSMPVRSSSSRWGAGASSSVPKS